MIQRFPLVVAGVALAATLQAPTARAVSPGENGRTAFLKAGDAYVFDGTFSRAVTNDGDWQDRVTWCGHESLVGERAGVGIVEVPVDHKTNAGTEFVIYRDPHNTLRDPACNAAGTRVAAVAGNTVFTVPTDGREGPSPLAITSSGGAALEPAWSSDDRLVAFEDAASPGQSAIEIASTDGRFVSGGRAVTPPSPGLRHGPSWWKHKIYYWKQPSAIVRSQGIFSVDDGNMNEFGPYGGTNSEACVDPAALPDGDGFECVGADTLIKRFPGPRTLNDTDARKPDVESLHHDHDHGHWH